MAYVRYNNNRLVPSPFVRFSKEVQNQPGGKVGIIWNISIEGTIVAYKGSPTSQGVFATGTSDNADETLTEDKRLAAIERKIEGIRNLFSTDGLKLEWLTESTSTAYQTTPIYCYPRVKSIDFPSDLWYDKATYTITLETDTLYGYAGLADESFTDYISSSSEAWSISEGDAPHIFSLSHEINAIGKRFYSNSGTVDIPAYQHARNYSRRLMGYNSGIVVQSMAISGIPSAVFNFVLLGAYNYSISENEDIQGGSYSVNENWILSSGTAIETYQLRVSQNTLDSNKVREVSLDGNVRGLHINQNDFENRFTNAKNYLTSIQPIFQARVDTYATGVHFVNSAIEYNPSQGSLSYNYNYNDQPGNSGTVEEYNVSSNYNAEDYKTTVTVAGKIIGLLTRSETDYTLKYPRALSWWNNNVKGLLLNRALIYSSGIHSYSGLLPLQSGPISKSFTPNIIEGSIDYSYSYNDRITANAIEEYTVTHQFSRDGGNTYSVAGTVQGLDFTGSGAIGERFNNAKAAFPTDANIYTYALTYATGQQINSSPTSREITRSPQAGLISYNYGYSNEPGPCFTNALSESITVTNINSCKVIPEIPILGRVVGPILQNPNIGTSRKRQINIELVMLPFSGVNCDYNGFVNAQPNTDTLVANLAPTGIQTYKIEDSEGWDIRRGRYNRNTTYIFEA